jgi:hypothetical protein
MKPWLWYLLVVVDGVLLISSFFIANILLAVIAFIMVLVLKRYYGGIPLPEQYEKLKRSRQ